jgi:hypothetical protein
VAPENEQKAGWGCLAKGLFALVLGTSMVTLVVGLIRVKDAGRATIQAYVASIKAGTNVTPAAAGLEAPRITDSIRRSSSFSVRNFRSQSDTSCFSVTFTLPGAEQDAAFVIDESASPARIKVVTFLRDCDCPDDANQPCRLE